MYYSGAVFILVGIDDEKRNNGHSEDIHAYSFQQLAAMCHWTRNTNGDNTFDSHGKLS